jgi:hypothetical protein
MAPNRLVRAVQAHSRDNAGRPLNARVEVSAAEFLSANAGGGR